MNRNLDWVLGQWGMRMVRCGVCGVDVLGGASSGGGVGCVVEVGME